jgi:hypothetical protein
MAFVCESAGGTRSLHRLLALGVLLVLAALVPLAHATPPDLAWLTGLWDDGDFDEVVVAVVSTSGIVTGSVRPSARPAQTAAGAVSLPSTVRAVGRASSVVVIRAPPSSGRIANIQ